MKYSERFFKFPVRVTDAYLADLKEKEAQLSDSRSLDIPTIDSWIKLPYSEIEGWQEMYPPETAFEDVFSKGFQCTLVFTKSHGDILCSWDFKKFEERLDAFEAKLAEFVKNSNLNSIKTN